MIKGLVSNSSNYTKDVVVFFDGLYKVFCIYCNWKGSPDDLNDEHQYTIKQRKSKLIKLKFI